MLSKDVTEADKPEKKGTLDESNFACKLNLLFIYFKHVHKQYVLLLNSLGDFFFRGSTGTFGMRKRGGGGVYSIVWFTGVLPVLSKAILTRILLTTVFTLVARFGSFFQVRFHIEEFLPT